MSEHREVDIKYGEHQFKLVRIERVYEVKDGEKKLIKDGGDFILRLAGHSPASLEAYKTDKKSFNTLEYQKKFLEENHYTTEDGRPAREILQESSSQQRSTTTTSAATRPAAPQPPSPASPSPEAPAPAADAPEPVPAQPEAAPAGLQLTPEQQSAYDLLNRDGILERIIAERTAQLEIRISHLERRLGIGPANAQPAPDRPAQDPDTVPPADAAREQALRRDARVTVNRGDTTFKGTARSGVYTKEGQRYIVVRDENGNEDEYKVSEVTLENVQPDPAATAQTPEATATTVTTTQATTTENGPQVPDNYRRISLRRGPLTSRWNRFRGIPGSVEEIYENRDTGRRFYYSETEEEWVPIRRDRGTLVAIFAGTAAVASVIGLGFHIHNKHDLEELEHRKAQPVLVKPVVVRPRVKVPTTTESEPTETQPDEPTTPETMPSAAPGTTTTENENGGGPDQDEPLSGGRSYFENTKKGGHGLELDYPKDTTVEKNPSGTYIFTASNGKRIRLTWNASGSLSPDTVNTLEANGYEVGKARTSFTDREDSRHPHYYSVIGDKDS